MQTFNWQALLGVPGDGAARYDLVVGVDEVGRGALAGPVYAAAVVLHPQYLNPKYQMVDSKILSPAKRQLMAQHIRHTHTAFVARASVNEIAQLNILWASILAMRRAVEGVVKLYAKSHSSSGALRAFVLVDGKYPIKNLAYPQQALIKGDQRAEPIAAASIVAKVARDSFLCQLDKKYPGYGLAQHKGYGTARHKQALRQLGATPIHRQHFAGVS